MSSEERASKPIGDRRGRFSTRFSVDWRESKADVKRATTRACNSRWLAFVAGLVLMPLTVFMHSSESAKNALFDKDREIVWYVVMVPCYTATFTFTCRYVGSFLARTWTREIVESEFLSDCIMDFIETVMQDRRIPEIVKDILCSEDIMDAIAEVLTQVLDCNTTSEDAAAMVAESLSNDKVIKAALGAVKRLAEDPEIRDCVVSLLDDPMVTAAVVTQLERLLEEDDLEETVRNFMLDVLDDKGVKETFHARAKSFAEDADVYSRAAAGVFGGGGSTSLVDESSGGIFSGSGRCCQPELAR